MSKRLSFQNVFNIQIINAIFYILCDKPLISNMYSIQCVFYTWSISQSSLVTFQLLHSYAWLPATVLSSTDLEVSYDGNI